MEHSDERSLRLEIWSQPGPSREKWSPPSDPTRRPSIRHGAPPPPRWAQRAATLVVLTTLPSGLWRTAMAVGIPVGVSDQIRHERYGFPGWGTVYLFGLTLLLVGLALLTFGLVHRWGEVVPHWIPLVGARRVPPLAAVVPAGSGAGAVTFLWLSALSNVEEIWAVYGLDGGTGADDGLLCTAAPLGSPPRCAHRLLPSSPPSNGCRPGAQRDGGLGPDSVRLRLSEEAVAERLSLQRDIGCG